MGKGRDLAQMVSGVSNEFIQFLGETAPVRPFKEGMYRFTQRAMVPPGAFSHDEIWSSAFLAAEVLDDPTTSALFAQFAAAVLVRAGRWLPLRKNRVTTHDVAFGMIHTEYNGAFPAFVFTSTTRKESDLSIVSVERRVVAL